MTEIPVLIFLILLIAILLVSLWRSNPSSFERRVRRRRKTDKVEETRPCPLCGSQLKKGELVRTVVYPGAGDRFAEMYGCPYCHGENSVQNRRCPVCKKTIPKDGFVLGRMNGEGRHLHVLGCTECKKNQPKRRNH